MSCMSETGEVGKRLLAGVHVHAPEFGAAMQARHRLARVQQTVLVEGALHRVENLELRSAELHAHVIDFLDADTVLAGDRSPDCYGELEDLGTESLGAL